MSVQKKVDLYYKDYRSDKEYHLQINANGHGYTVTAQFGPRGKTLTHVDLTKGKSVLWSEAIQIFDKKETEKRAKGYAEIKRSLKQRLQTELQFLYLTDYSYGKLAEWIENYVEEQI